jgi:hypothetical protein
MQGSWTLHVKTKAAAYPQQFIVSGAVSGNGTYSGVVGATPVYVTGPQWSIAIMHDPGTGFQLSDMKLKFPQQIGGQYQFDIQSNDTGNDQDFDDLVLTCSIPVSPNEFIVYGNVSTYKGNCIFNPCLRKGPFVIESKYAFEWAYKNPHLKSILDKLYPERIPEIIDPNPPDPTPFFKPVVIDLFSEAMQPKTVMQYSRLSSATEKVQKAKSDNNDNERASFSIEKANTSVERISNSLFATNKLQLATTIDKMFRLCQSKPAKGVMLTFDEYDRTNSELSGGAYTGSGDRRALGETMTDQYGNYIFRFRFDMNAIGGFEDDTDQAAGELASQYLLPDVIAKLTGLAPWDVLYETAPYYNVPNLKRINLCIPERLIRTTSACANGSLIGSIGNVFLGGNQNTAASFSSAALQRYGFSNFLEANGKISVTNFPNLAQFTADCAAWSGVLDIFGCMYDETKSLAQNTIAWYTIRIRRAGAAGWTFVSENYKHPLYSKRHNAGYIGDNVGSFPVSLHVDGAALITEVPAYKNIRREVHTGGVDTDWVDSKIDRLIQLNTSLYDVVDGIHTPGTFYLRIDGYDEFGNPVAGKTDMIPLFIHNKALKFGFSGPQLDDPSILDAGCGLLRLTDAQLNTDMLLSFMANDEDGFVDNYHLTIGRCPSMISIDREVGSINSSGLSAVISEGTSTALHSSSCAPYRGTSDEFPGNDGMIPVVLKPSILAPNPDGGWIKPGEYFTNITFALTANMRLTNGYNTGLSGTYHAYGQILLEKLNP